MSRRQHLLLWGAGVAAAAAGAGWSWWRTQRGAVDTGEPGADFWNLRFERPEDGDHLLIVEQGFEMGRPSLMMLEVIVREGKLVGASIGGSVVTVMQGTLAS